MRAIAAFFALLTLWVTPASADWQFTKWGQPLRDILSLSAEGVRKTSSKEKADWQIDTVGNALAKSPYRASDIDVTAVFLFRKNALAGVNLQIASPADALTLRNLLAQQYGKPISDKGSTPTDCASVTTRWRDEPAGNAVEFHSYECVGGLFFGNVLYTPIISATDSGL